MSHHHHHHPQPENIKLAFALNLIFTIIEIVGAYFTNSMAILSDAIHDLGDCLALGFAWYFEVLSHKQKNTTFTYGYRRFSILAATLNATILILGSLFILKESIPRLFQPTTPHVTGMLGLAILGVIFNGAAFLKVKHGHSHNEKVVSLHLLEDVLGWVAVLISSVIMYFYPWYILDTLISLAIAAFILFNAYKNLKESLAIFLQMAPASIDLDQFTTEIEALPDVIELHDIHLWSLDSDYHILTIHLVTPDEISIMALQNIKKEVRQIVRSHQLTHITIEFETKSEACGQVCQ